MIKGTIHFAYGIKIIAFWMLIPFIILFIPLLSKEFSFKADVVDVTLKEEHYSMYPDETSCFWVDLNGSETVIFTPVTARPGDTVSVITRDGKYFKTIKEEKDYRDYVSVPGRFLKICNNNFGYHVIGLAAALLLSSLVTLKKGKEIRKLYPKLSKITFIAGAVISGIMSVSNLYGGINNLLLYSIAIVYLGLLLGIIYTAIFVLAWITECVIINKAAP